MKNGGQVKVERPLAGRPDFVLVTLPDGRMKRFGDGQSLTHEEYNAITRLVEPDPAPRPSYTDDEAAMLDGAEVDVAAAERLVGQRLEAVDRAHRRVARAEAAGYRALGEAGPNEVAVFGGDGAPARKGPAGELRRAQQDLEEAQAIRAEAWRARAVLRNRINARARSRMPPPALKGTAEAVRVDETNWRERLDRAARQQEVT